MKDSSIQGYKGVREGCPSGSCLSGVKGKAGEDRRQGATNAPCHGWLLFPWVCWYLYKKEANLAMGPFFLPSPVAEQHSLVQTGAVCPASSSGAATAPSVPPIVQVCSHPDGSGAAPAALQEAGGGHEAIRHHQAARQLPGLWKRGRENKLFCFRSLKQICEAGRKGSSGLK